MDYSWEGNVRELRNIIESMAVAAKDEDVLGMDKLPDYFLSRAAGRKEIEDAEDAKNSEPQPKRLTYHDMMDYYEEKIIRNALEEAGGNISKAGEILDIPRETLRYRIKKLGI